MTPDLNSTKTCAFLMFFCLRGMIWMKPGMQDDVSNTDTASTPFFQGVNSTSARAVPGSELSLSFTSLRCDKEATLQRPKNHWAERLDGFHPA